MIFGVSPSKDAVVIAHATGPGETFAIKSIKSIQFQARSGDDLRELLRALIVMLDRGKSQNPTIGARETIRQADFFLQPVLTQTAGR
jgi:hypothetical protein